MLRSIEVNDKLYKVHNDNNNINVCYKQQLTNNKMIIEGKHHRLVITCCVPYGVAAATCSFFMLGQVKLVLAI